MTLPRASGSATAGSWAFAVLGGSVLGAALQLRQPALWHAWLYTALLLAAAVGLWVLWRPPLPLRRLPGGVLVAIALVCGALAGAGQAGLRAVVHAGGALDPALEGRDLQVTGMVSEMPQRGEHATRFRLDVESARWAGTGPNQNAPNTPPVVPERIALGWYAENTGQWGRSGEERTPSAITVGALHAGERWRLTVRLKAPHGNLNPYGFDSELWMWEQGVHANGYVRTGGGDAAPALVASTWRHPIERAREAVRDKVFERVPDRAQAGVIAALVTGDQGAIDRAGWDVFRATGVAHLMSISGLHITMFAWLAAHLVGLLWRRATRLMLWLPAPQAALLGGVLLAALYALFSGWGVPSQRTVWMLATVGLLRLSGRRWPWPHVWLLTAAVVVALDPWALMQAGFWLSFVAVGVLFATDAAAPGEAKKKGFRAHVFQLCREQWVITLAITPLSLLLFQQVSLVGLLANAVAIPWVTLVVTPLAMLGTAVAPLWDVAGWAVHALVVLLQWCAGLPYATLSMAAPPGWMAACGVAGGVLLAMRLPWSLRSLGVPLLLPVLLWQAPRPMAGEFELLAADIGQGNAVLVRTATHSLLYDAGPRYSLESDAGHRVLVPLLRAYDEHLDMMLLSHRDADHAGGVPAVLAMQPRATLLSSIEPAHPLRALRAGPPCEAGQQWDWDGVHFEIVHPLATDYRTGVKPNAISCVLRIGNGRATALLAGDIESDQERALVQRQAGLTGRSGLVADVLLVPHHGSKTSSSELLLDAVRPRIALVQAGYRNRFGHPAAQVTARYAAHGTRVVDSVRCGAAHWRSERPGEVACERERNARYWHHAVP
ncbi:DNA internalization-related competence protein ComEC/Rec2 [Variovorax sp. KBW07]|uniref:DNA internalization-related competence protein ComEC/Rec2 n=1 Tax=Variovorax sp. KBW07 TaxID=2153358 RepID=UPI000F56431B|nr:DNA internalization-related competence protein ComEC/Rec2 [Variovorax sp. KBW07]RQO64674.1 DNA internalization-related competence protein ComEC/Rec2 [Variovorax sp. KBW07]